MPFFGERRSPRLGHRRARNEQDDHGPVMVD